MTKNTSYHVPLLLAICSIAFFSHLSSYTPPSIMEARNFISAREMVESGNWMIPTLNGTVRIRKPPLPTWLTAASIGIYGDHNDLTALRFPAALMATVMILFLYGLIRDLLQDSNVAFYAAAVLATSYMFIEESRTGAWDIYSNAFMLGAIWMFHLASKYNRLKHWSLAGMLMGLSFMSKGPVSFYAMLLPFLAAFFISKHHFTRHSFRGLIICLLIMIVISGIWPLYLYLKIPDLAAQIVNEESSAWINRHNRPFWFYLHFPLFTGVWTVIAVAALFSYKRLKTSFSLKQLQFILFWFLITLLLLSVIPEKKERYFLPALPPLATLIGILIMHHTNSLKAKDNTRAERIILFLQGSLMAIAILVIPVIVWLYADKTGTSVLITVFILSLSIVMIVGIYKKRLKYVYPATIVVMLSFCLFAWPYISFLKQDNPNYRDLREVRDIKAIASRPIYTTSQLNPIRIWEIGRKITIVEDTNDIANEAVLISETPLPEAKEVFVFHPNRDNEKEVLYFNLVD